MSERSIFNKTHRENILAVATGGVCVAAAFVLSQLKYPMPQGGSITPASMLPIFFFALCFGPAWGFAGAFVYSLLQLIGGYFLMPAQVLLDYTIAYTVLGVSGFFAAPKEKRLTLRSVFDRLRLVSLQKMALSVLLGISLRFICAVLSGVLFFSSYAQGQNPWLYSALYNGSYLLPEASITVAALLAVGFATRIPKRSRSGNKSDEGKG